MNKTAEKFIQAAIQKFGSGAVLNRADIQLVTSELDIGHPAWFTTDQYRVGRGTYKLPEGTTSIMNKKTEKVESETVDMVAQVTMLRAPKLHDESDPSVPEKFDGYVPFGFFSDLKNIIKSKKFYPVFITGLSGNGKTLMVEQVCADLNRECIRINISIETDQTDLLGGPTLINGNVVNRDGPVILAMKRGAILLIDEVDRGSNKLMCIQGIMEGKPYYNKNTGEVVHPKPGFNIVATANTKGRGSDEGRYLSQILDDAFLERFPITVEQEYPNSKTEQKILKAELDKHGLKEEEHAKFVDKLVSWAEVIRKTFDDGGVDEIISTRRLVHIIKAYAIFKNKKKAIELCVSRFDTETKNSFIDLYTKVDAEVDGEAPVEEAKPVVDPEVSF